MKKSLKKSNKIIILSVVLLAFFCLSAFKSTYFSPIVSAEDGYTYFYGDFIKVEGTTYRDLGITGYYLSSDTINVGSPNTGDPDQPFFGYYNTSYTTNTGTDTEYTINIYNLFMFETPEVTENTVVEILTQNNLRFYVNNWSFHSEESGSDFISFIPTNKTINLFNLLEKIYPDELTEGDPEYYPGTPEWSFIIDVGDNIFDLFYTQNLDNKEDADSNFSRLCGFVIGPKGYVSSAETDFIDKTNDGVYYYKIGDEFYDWRYATLGNFGSDKVYLNFQPFEETAGGFFLSDEILRVDHAGPLGQGYNFDYAQVNGYGKNNFNFRVAESIPANLTLNNWSAVNPIDYRVIDFNAIQLHYKFGGEIYTLYQEGFPAYSNYAMRRITNTSDLMSHLYQYDNGKYYYNSFACCFSPYVGEVKILSSNQPPARYNAGKTANIIAAALWVVLPPLMLIGSIIQGISYAINGENFFDGVRDWTLTIRDGVAQTGQEIAEFFEDFNKEFLPGLPQPVKEVAENPNTWLLLILAALIALIVVVIIRTKKNK